MAFSEQQPLADIIGAFARPRKPTQIPIWEGASDVLRFDLLPGFKSDYASNRASLDQFARNLAASTPELQRLATEDIGLYSDLIRSGRGYDPLSTYNAIREGNLGALDKQFGSLVDYGSAADKARLAAMGYGGRASTGSFGKILDATRASRNLSPILGQIFGNLGSDFSRVSGDRYSNILNLLGLAGERSAVPDRLAARALLPVQARQQFGAQDVANLAQLIDTYKGNIGGWMENKSGLQRWSDAVRGLERGIGAVGDTALSLYTGGMGGGGGMMGSGGGGSIDIGSILRMLGIGGQGSGRYQGPTNMGGGISGMGF